jgi:hypothetical protein
MAAPPAPVPPPFAIVVESGAFADDEQSTRHRASALAAIDRILRVTTRSGPLLVVMSPHVRDARRVPALRAWEYRWLLDAHRKPSGDTVTLALASLLRVADARSTGAVAIA